MRRAGSSAWLAVALLAVGTPAARAEADDDEDAEEDRDEDEDEGGDDDEDAGGDGGFRSDDDDIERQGDDDGAAPEISEFERNLFYVDKVDDAKSIDRTLWQGSLTSSSFLYREQGGALGGAAAGTCVDDDSPACVRVAAPSARYFTELRAQAAGQHLAGGNWDLRLDGRIRFVADPANRSRAGLTPPYDVRAQSGAFGRNEYELRQLTVDRIGESTRFVAGRQHVLELGATRLDGLRLDWARSDKLTLIGFAGLSPARGSRSFGTDYPGVTDEAGAAAGRLLTIAGGAGAAYRVEKAYGAAGAVVMVPGKGEAPRAFLTSNGYLRTSPQLDVYHYALIDVVGDAGFALTNLSAGADYRPKPRLRLSAALHRVDVETLDILARRVLEDPNTATAVENGTEIRRIASNQARLGVSASLGAIEQIEVSTALAFRQRGEIPITNAVPAQLPAAQNGEVWAQAVHRNLFRSRVGLDVSRTFGIGEQSFDRSTALAVRAFVSREFREGRGEWDAELGYATAKDQPSAACNATGDALNPLNCYGNSASSTLSARGTVYYLLRQDVFVLGSLDVSSASSETAVGMTTTTDPARVGLAAYARVAYRF